MSGIWAHPFSGLGNTAGVVALGWSGCDTYALSGGRWNNGQCVRFYNNHFDFPSVASGKVIVQFAFKNTGTTLRLYNNSGADQCLELQNIAGGQWQVKDQTGTVVGTSAAVGPLVDDAVWHFLAIEAEIGSGAGTVRVWMDDATTPILNLSGIDLDAGAGTGADRVFFANGNFGRMQDLVIYDTSGSDGLSAFTSDFHIYALLPNGDDTAAWSRSGGTTNSENVDDPVSSGGASDGDGTYVYSAGAQIDKYNMDDLPSDVTTVYSVVGVFEAAKSDAGAEPTTNIRIDSGGTTTDGSALPSLSTTYKEYQTFFPDVPGGTGWTPSQVNGLKLCPRTV